MNRMFKVGLAALALAAVTPAFAQEVEEEEGPIGFTPVAFLRNGFLDAIYQKYPFTSGRTLIWLDMMMFTRPIWKPLAQ